jgi:polysaccharide pyruvyl transferase WcaK-like protein
MGNFGNGNLGNECTLQAILHNCRQYLPEAEIAAVCTNPDDVSKRHGVRAIHMSDRHKKSRGTRNSRISGILRKVFFRIPAEILRCVRTYLSLNAVDMLIMTGTGMITDDEEGSWGLPYEILKWTVIAKIRGSRVFFVSVGAEHIKSSLTKLFFTCALFLADYRSFRDIDSRTFLCEVGIRVQEDPIYPDLAYSLPLDYLHEKTDRREGGVIGVGVLDYTGQGKKSSRGKADHDRYINTVVDIILWLVENHYSVRILIGDVKYDNPVKQEIKTVIEQRGYKYENMHIIDEPIGTVSDLLFQLSKTIMIIASRFHNVLLSLMLNVPVISLSYNFKNDALMKRYRLDKYCQGIDEFDFDRLKEQFINLGNEPGDLLRSMEDITEEFRAELIMQYKMLFVDGEKNPAAAAT